MISTWRYIAEHNAEITYQGPEDDGEKVQLRGRGRETPEEEGDEAAAECAHEHDPRVRELVAQMAEHNLTDDGRRVEDGQDDRRRQRGGESACEAGDVERYGEVGEPLKQRRKPLEAGERCERSTSVHGKHVHSRRSRKLGSA